MRIALSVALLLAMPAQAALLADPAGDQRSVTTGQGFAGEEQGDLVALEIEEIPEGFWFHVSFATLQGDLDGERPSGSSATIPLRFGDVNYQVRVGKGPATITYYDGSLRRVESDGETTQIRYGDTFADETVRSDVGAASISFIVFRDELVNELGKVPAAGDVFVIGQVNGRVDIEPVPGGPGDTILDLMPNVAEETTFAVALGPATTSLRVTSPDAFRRSNGAATTYRFEFNVTNVESEQRFAANVIGLPATWETRTVPSTFELAKDASRTIAVYVNTPFGHQHGGIDAGTLKVSGVVDSQATGGALFGVRYLPTPQPAGHHDSLFLHSTRTSTSQQAAAVDAVLPDHPRTPLYMNTLEEDAADTLDAIPPSLVPAPPGGGLVWLAPLAPELAIGLSFEPNGVGTVDVPLGGGVPLGPAKISSRLMLVGTDGADPTRLQHPLSNRGVTDLLRAEPQDVTLDGSQFQYSAQLLPTDAATVIPYAKETDLVLEIFIELMHPVGLLSASLPVLSPGAWLQLPLLEYADAPVETLTSGVEIQIAPASREANPGDVLVWNVTANPRGASLESIGEPSLDLHLVTRRGVTFLVATVPEGARRGDLLPVYVLGSSGANEGSALAHIRVVTDADVPDDAALAARLQGGKQDAPGWPAWTIIVGLLAFALRRRLAK